MECEQRSQVTYFEVNLVFYFLSSPFQGAEVDLMVVVVPEP